MPRQLTVEQAATKLNVHKDTIRRAIRTGELPAVRDRLHAGSAFLVTEEDLAAFVTKRTAPVVEGPTD